MKNYLSFFIDYSIVVFLTILINVIIRIGECFYLVEVKYEEINVDLLISKSINFDSLFIILFSLAFLIPSLAVYTYSFKIGKIFTRFLFSLIVLVFLIFTEYFLINNALLSNSLFDFSLAEITSIALTELSINRLEFTLFSVFLMFILVFIFIKSASWNTKSKFILYAYIIFSIVSCVNYKYTFKPLRFFKNYNNFLIGNSKPVFFLKSYLESFKVNDYYSQQEIKDQIVQFQDYYKNEKVFLNLDYPLVNQSNYENVLGPFFKTKNIRPNIVVVVSESLSASFSGSKLSIKKSITPFTDSLANGGLSWSNFFSNAERSYGVLPNLLGSLLTGVGTRGFINMEKDTASNLRFPQHNSLIHILNQNNYLTSYYYGGSGHFDNVDKFIDQNSVDNRVTLCRFDTSKYFRFDTRNSEAVWGFNDKDLFDQGVDFMDSIDSNQPYLSVFQTLSNHSPYNLSDESYYSDQYLSSKLKSLGLTFDDVKKIEKKILSSIFYADDALKHLFYRLKKRADFNNTIFIITGDHAVDLNLNKDIFENYRTPLIIYSPLLVAENEFKGVCSHVDVLPSLLALLSENYKVSIPQKNHWLGIGLDTNSSFSAKRFIPLNLNALDIPNVIIDDKVLFGEEVFMFNERFEITKITDTLEQSKFMKRYLNYQIINKHCCANNMIWRN